MPTIIDGSGSATFQTPLPSLQGGTGITTFQIPVPLAQGGTGATGYAKVLSTAKTDTFTTSSATYTDLTGLSVTITPQFASSKILVSAQVNLGCNTAGARVALQLLRGATAIGIGDTAGSRTRGTTAVQLSSPAGMNPASMEFLDSPATTLATTYKVQLASIDSVGAIFVNRTNNDDDAASRSRTISTITVTEVFV